MRNLFAIRWAYWLPKSKTTIFKRSIASDYTLYRGFSQVKRNFIHGNQLYSKMLQIEFHNALKKTAASRDVSAKSAGTVQSLLRDSLICESAFAPTFEFFSMSFWNTEYGIFMTFVFPMETASSCLCLFKRHSLSPKKSP